MDGWVEDDDDEGNQASSIPLSVSFSLAAVSLSVPSFLLSLLIQVGPGAICAVVAVEGKGRMTVGMHNREEREQ